MVPGYARQRVTYGELIGGRHFHHKLEWNKHYGNPLGGQGRGEAQGALRVQGRRQVVPAESRHRKGDGRASSTSPTCRVEGMLHARVIRPPNAGCTPVAVDEGSISGIPGARVVREKDFVAVVAEREWDAVRAAEALKVTWARQCAPFPPMEKLHEHIREAKPNGSGAPVNRGDVDAALARARRVVTAEYEWPLQSHASMGPACAVADMASDEPRLWTGSQKPHYGRVGCAMLTGLPPEKVRATWVVGPGLVRPQRRRRRRARCRAAVEAHRPHRCACSTCATTAPPGIRRGPAAVFRGRAGLDAAGNVIAYHFHGKGFSRQDVIQLESDPKDTLAGQLTGLRAQGRPHLPGAGGALRVREQALRRGKRYRRCSTAPRRCAPATCATRSARRRISRASRSSTRSRTRPARIPSRSGCATSRTRAHVAAVKAVAEKASWQARPNPESRQGRRHDRPRLLLHRAQRHRRRDGRRSRGGPRASGRVWAKKFTVAHDCGQIINPGSLQNVIEGNVVQAVSRTLFEEVRFNENRVLERRLGDLSDPRARRRAANRSTSCSSTGRRCAPHGRRRAVDAHGAGGDRERDLRRDRRADAPRAASRRSG